MDDKLFLRFCNTHDIALKKNKFLNYKCKYLCAVSNLKQKGIKQSTMRLTDDLIDKNIDKLYHGFNKTETRDKLTKSRSMKSYTKYKG